MSGELVPIEKRISYLHYHERSMEAGDVDPQYPMLRYIAERWELSQEQRLWLAWLYSCTYCGPTAYYMLQEFPDFENVDTGRLERWWECHRHQLIFQTDRRWVRSRNQFCDMFRSYRKWCAGATQAAAFQPLLLGGTPQERYEAVFESCGQLYQFGRFALFLYLEALRELAGMDILPSTMDLREAESCRNGLALAYRLEELNNHESGRKLSAEEMQRLQWLFDNKFVPWWQSRGPQHTVWKLETTLCAYKKYCYGKRHIGYYLERQEREIRELEEAVVEGVDWSLLWDFRREVFGIEKPEEED